MESDMMRRCSQPHWTTRADTDFIFYVQAVSAVYYDQTTWLIVDIPMQLLAVPQAVSLEQHSTQCPNSCSVSFAGTFTIRRIWMTSLKLLPRMYPHGT